LQDFERARSIYELAIDQPLLDMYVGMRRN